MIKVRLPSHWSKDDEDYEPPIYDSEPEDEYEPRVKPRCRYHWATCDDDNCEVHEDQKQINNYYPKQDKLVTQPSFDHPEIDNDEAQ